MLLTNKKSPPDISRGLSYYILVHDHFPIYALRLTPYALRLTPYALRLTPYALRLTPYALRLLHFHMTLFHLRYHRFRHTRK